MGDEPVEKVRAEENAKHKMNKERQATCKNADFVLKTTKQDYKKYIFEFESENRGCINLRRSGSAYCQDCSDRVNN